MTQRQRHPWPHDDVASDFEAACCGGGYGSTPTTEYVKTRERAEPVTMYEILAVHRWYVSYHGQQWKPGDGIGTELSLCAVLRLRGGWWAAVVAGNDYTGWGCQDHADVRIGRSEAEVVKHGLDAEGRQLLGYRKAGRS